MTKSVYTRFAAGVLFPLHEFAKRHHTIRLRRKLEISEWWEPNRLHEAQAAALRKLVTHAERHVPYYRRLFREHGVSARDIATPRELGNLPFLTKAIIRANVNELRSECARPLVKLSTGGSTGEPLVFYTGRERITHDVAAKWRATRWWGVDIGDREVVLWGSPVELGAQDRLRAVRDWFLRTELIPAFDMSDARLDACLERIKARRPAMLFGYPSALSLLAGRAEARGLEMAHVGIRVAFVTAERLYPYQREQIARVFGCAVANGYGGRDAGFVAHECPSGGMHINAEDIVLEIVDSAGNIVPPGTAGEIVITHLATADYPFIRYRTGDVATIAQDRCPCGRGLPVLQEVHGRTTDFIVAANGTLMHGLAVVYPIRELTGIEAFKIVQESMHCTRVEVVPGAAYGPETEQLIRSGLRARLGQSVEIVVDTLPAIPPEKSGKYRYVVSKVSV